MHVLNIRFINYVRGVELYLSIFWETIECNKKAWLKMICDSGPSCFMTSTNFKARYYVWVVENNYRETILNQSTGIFHFPTSLALDIFCIWNYFWSILSIRHLYIYAIFMYYLLSTGSNASVNIQAVKMQYTALIKIMK